MKNSEIPETIFLELFRKYYKKAKVYIRASKIKDENFDPYRNTGFDETSQNAVYVKVLTKTVSPTSLIYREIGNTESGALDIILHNRDVTIMKNSENITIGANDFYVYSDAVGGKLQIFPTSYSNYSKMTIFRKDLGTT